LSNTSRYRSLETAFEWTWDLLEDDEREVLCRLAALPRTFDLELAEAVTGPGSAGVVLRLLDRSLVVPADFAAQPRRFRLLNVTREFVLRRTDPAAVRQVRELHAAFHNGQACELTARARTDDSPEDIKLANQLCPEVNAAVHWALDAQHPLALSLATALAVGVEQYGSDVDSLRTLARAAQDPQLLAAAQPADLLKIGTTLCLIDLELVDRLAQRALAIADDAASRLAAHHLAGLADANRGRAASALLHLDQAERLAGEAHATWELAAVRQARGIALRSLGNGQYPEAIAAFEQALQDYARAGDALHVSNVRYMMATTAAEAGLEPVRARAWARQCADYARANGNQHELAHALLTESMLSANGDSGTVANLEDAVATFRELGDLRCLTQGTVQLAERVPVRRVQLLQLALDTAKRAHDAARHVEVLERLIRAHWEDGDHRLAFLNLGALASLIGEGPARGRCPARMLEDLDQWSATVAEGRAKQPRVE
jgi:tetratricopeptide (TPR) repeat protein